jgi:hypothetical protein
VSVAAGKPAPPPAQKPPYDPFRAPIMRHAMNLMVPNAKGQLARVIVLEMRAAVRLALDLDDDGIGVRHVDLALSEAWKLAEMLNAIRRRALARKEWTP